MSVTVADEWMCHQTVSTFDHVENSDPQWTERIERTLRYFGARLEKIGRAVPMMAAALSVYTAGLQQVVIAEAEHDDGAMARALALDYLSRRWFA